MHVRALVIPRIPHPSSSFGGFQHAYYITFIRVDPERTYGGWFAAERLRPFTRADGYPRFLMDLALLHALLLSSQYLDPEKCALRRRLLDLSFAATGVNDLNFRFAELV